MDFKQIEAFITVARLKSFSKAANTIYLSQPTISSHILSLEKELKVQLFDRNSKEVNLTPAGKCFLDYAVDIVNTRNNAVSSLGDFNNNICGTLDLSASTTPCNTIVPSLIDKFSKLYPEINFNIVEQSSGSIINDIVNLHCEIGIVGNIVESDRIKSYFIMEDSLILISNPSMNLPDKVSIDILTQYRFIMREKNSATRKTFEAELTSQGYPPENLNVCCEVNNLDTLLQFVKAGLGVSIVSKKVAEDYVSCGKLKSSIIDGLSLKRSIYLVTNSKRTLTPTARAFLNMCKEHFNLKD
jgi:DNA-binding transcriptional LysR family regulator